MERAACGGSCFFECVGGQNLGDLGDPAGGGEGLLNIVALKVDVGINFVSDSVVALVALEANIVSGRADPERLTINFKWRFPDAQMIARGYDFDGLGMRPAVV